MTALTASSGLRALLTPRTAGVGEGAPPLRLWPFALVLGLLALQVIARYRWGFLEDSRWQWAHILIGWGAAGLVLLLAHGRRLRRALTPRVLLILGLTFVCLLVFWYGGRSDSFRRLFPDHRAAPDSVWVIAPFIYFASNATFWRLLVPFAVVRLSLGLAPASLGLPLRRPVPASPADAAAARLVPWVYLLLFLGVLPFVVMASSSPVFLAKYPLSRDMVASDGTMLLSHLVAFELFYLLVFISGESFWRGLIGFGLERDLGLYGLLFMVVPYVTSHFGKPLAETLGAIAAGLVLGFLALKHRSVWLGVALHYAIALSMDLLAIANHGYSLR